MPQNANYAPILPLITTPRLNHFITTFRPIQDCEIYGVYIWTQHAASSIYPLLQNLEITLRNSIDREATRRFGQEMVGQPGLTVSKPNTKHDFLQQNNPSHRQAEFRLGFRSSA
ncbi:Uncharacterised protein [Klebsiella pneumoniae]|uniref:Uncharacterized protein n=1 Tax=Klebsiella pneumoniae TaxID=573 RepID=A0A377V2C4_KLEPN|nr:Uncharacterised protein [Klebsiella pneumoniae]